MNIKVGDMIYFERWGTLSYRQMVLKITPSGLIKTDRHNIRYDGTHLSITGQGNWRTITPKLETPELKAEYEQIMATLWLSDNLSKIKTEDIKPLMKKYGKK